MFGGGGGDVVCGCVGCVFYFGYVVEVVLLDVVDLFCF